MKKYTNLWAVNASLFILLICASLKTFSQSLNYDTTFNGWNAKVHLPWNYYQTQDSFQLIVFFPGKDEVGTNISKLLVYGPHKYLANGWNGNVLIGIDTVKFIIVSLQPPAEYPAESFMNTRLASIRSVYRERSNSIHLTGLSHGGWCSTTFVTADAYGGPYTYAGQIASVVEVEGVKPDDNSPYPNLFDNFANAGGRLLAFEQVNDGRDVPTRVNRMNSTVANSAIFVATNFGNGGHCCFDNFYGASSAPNNFTLDGISQNLYQWMARQGTIGGGGGNQSPTANAGSNQTVTLPTSSASLSGSGSDADGSITAYAWTKISGPSGSTITSPGSQNTSVTGLVQGTYVFRLTVTDDDGATGTDDVQITVNAGSNQSPTANAGSDQTVTLPTSSASLSGSGSDADGSITAYAWTKISGPSGSTITSPGSQNTSVTGLVQGTYVFRLTVTDDDAATGTDDVQITVNAGNQSPTANAGSNQTITLPASSASLSGSGSDADGSITAYAWTKISGPSGSTITSPSSQNTSVTGLVQGTYVFRLTVTDDDAATGTDDVQVTVNAAQQQGTADTIRVNVYGGSDPYGNSAWNNWNVSSGLTSSTFTNVNAQATAVTATITASQGVSDNGSGYGGTMCPPEVLRYTSFATSNRTLTLNNLDTSATYDIIFYASRGNTGNGTIFNVGSLSDTVVTDNNKTITGDLTNIDPASNGTIAITLSRTNAGGFQYLNGFTLIKHGQGTPPVANAGSDVTTYMPKTSVQLSGSDITGTATTIQWSKLSGGAHSQEGALSSATVLNPVINNIGVGNYVYELYVSNATGSDRDTVIVHGMPQKSRAPNPNFEKFTLTPVNTEIYFNNIMSVYPTLNGGDTLLIASNVPGVIQLYGDDGSGGWGGDSLYPVVVINPPGQQITIGGSFRINGQYIKVTGSGDAGIKYGFKLTGQATSGFALPAKHSNIEIERCYILKGDVGIYAKSNIDSMNVLTYHPNWHFKKDWFHDNLFDSTGGESMYIGHTFSFDVSQPSSGYIPVKFDGLLIEKDSVRWAGWDGIQTSNALNVTVRNNYVYETGRALISNQLFGIILGGYSTGRVDSNEIHFARSAGIAVFGNDTVKVRGNKLDSCGYADIQTNGNAGSGNPFTAIYVNDNQASSIGAPSPSLKIVIDNNCIQKVSTYINGAAIRSTNGNGTTHAGYITNNTIQDAQGRALNNLIYSNTPGEAISGNTLGSCTPQSPLVMQVNIYGGTNPYNNVEWNNWNVSSGLTSPALNYTNGNASAVTATLTASQGISDNSDSYGGTMCPPEVLRYASNATSNRTLTIDNLNSAKTYDLEFYASRSNTGNSTVFTIGSLADTVVTDSNKTVTANFSAIAPDSTNKITISLARLSGTTFQYLNGFKITENASGSFGRIVSNQRNPVPVIQTNSPIRPDTISNLAKPTKEIHADLSIYPNPANNLLTIKYESMTSGNVKVWMYDISGRVAKSQTFNKNQIVFQQRLNINSLTAGLYYLMITDNSGNRWVSKFLKL